MMSSSPFRPVWRFREEPASDVYAAIHSLYEWMMPLTPRKLLPSSSALAAFEAVGRLGSFSAAADELSLTQSAVSLQVAALEEQLGVTLFVRTSRSVGFTDAGREAASRGREKDLVGVAELVGGDRTDLEIKAEFGRKLDHRTARDPFGNAVIGRRDASVANGENV